MAARVFWEEIFQRQHPGQAVIYYMGQSLDPFQVYLTIQRERVRELTTGKAREKSSFQRSLEFMTMPLQSNVNAAGVYNQIHGQGAGTVGLLGPCSDIKSGRPPKINVNPWISSRSYPACPEFPEPGNRN